MPEIPPQSPVGARSALVALLRHVERREAFLDALDWTLIDDETAWLSTMEDQHLADRLAAAERAAVPACASASNRLVATHEPACDLLSEGPAMTAHIDTVTRLASDMTARYAAVEDANCDRATLVSMLHDMASTTSLLEDIPNDDQAVTPVLRLLGRISRAFMHGVEALSAEHTRMTLRLERKSSDMRVMGSLLGLSILFNALLVALLVTRT